MKSQKITVTILIVTVLVLAYLLVSRNKGPSDFDPLLPMAGSPCHQMGGQWMGDCEFDSRGNVIPPSN